MRLRKFRGLGIRHYMFWSAIGVVGAVYTFKPVIDELEKRQISKEQQTALSNIEAAKEVIKGD